MKKLLLINSSINGNAGNSTMLSKEFVDKLVAKQPSTAITIRDLVQPTLPHLSDDEMTAWMTPEEERNEQQHALANLSDNLINELQEHDTIVIGMPMYNFGIPSTFKSWIDRVARAGITFKYTEQGPQGLLSGKKVYIVAARGGLYEGTPMDTQTKYLKDVFGFIGITDVDFIYAEGLNMPQKEQGLEKARSKMEQLVAA